MYSTSLNSTFTVPWLPGKIWVTLVRYTPCALGIYTVPVPGTVPGTSAYQVYSIYMYGTGIYQVLSCPACIYSYKYTSIYIIGVYIKYTWYLLYGIDSARRHIKL